MKDSCHRPGWEPTFPLTREAVVAQEKRYLVELAEFSFREDLLVGCAGQGVSWVLVGGS
jgi:hypothetical protein